MGRSKLIYKKWRKLRLGKYALKGHGQMDPFASLEVQKELMLERFGEENPGFDFLALNFLVPPDLKFYGRCKV